MVLHRIALPLLNSFLITAALFTFMYSLIYMKEPQLSSSLVLPSINFAYVPREEEVIVDTVKPKPPELIDERPSVDAVATLKLDAIEAAPWVEPELGPGDGTSLLPADNQLVIALGFPPEYPNRAIIRGIEGFAVVGFSVSAAGEVYDPYILEAEPKGYFERSSLKAITKFRYRARTIDSKPVATEGQRYMFTYKLDKS